MERYEELVRYYKSYMGEGTHLTLFWCAMFLLVILTLKKNDFISKKIVIYVGLISIIYWSSFTSEILLKFLTGYNVYCRMFWLFPISIMIAYAVVLGIKMMDNKIKRVVLLWVSIMMIVSTGKYMFTEENFENKDNVSKLPNSTPEICEVIEKDAKENEIDYIRAIVEDTLVCYIRQYDANIKMNYGRPALAYEGNTRNILNDSNFDIDRLLEVAYDNKSNYLVLYSCKDITSAIECGKCRLVKNIGNYSVYYVNEL